MKYKNKIPIMTKQEFDLSIFLLTDRLPEVDSISNRWSPIRFKQYYIQDDIEIAYIHNTFGNFFILSIFTQTKLIKSNYSTYNELLDAIIPHLTTQDSTHG